MTDLKLYFKVSAEAELAIRDDDGSPAEAFLTFKIKGCKYKPKDREVIQKRMVAKVAKIVGIDARFLQLISEKTYKDECEAFR